MNLASSEGEAFEQIQTTIADAFSNMVRNFDPIVEAVTQIGGPAAGAQARADALMFALHFGAAGAQYAFEQDPACPVLEKFLSYTGKNHGIGNPDCTYHHAALDARYHYRVTGNRGSVRLLDVEIASHTIADHRQVTADSFTKRGIEIPPGEDFTLTLSREPYDGLWLQLPDEGPCFIIFRQYAYDWDTEEPATLMIERIGAAYPPPPNTPEVIAERAAVFSRWMQSEYLVPNRLAILGKKLNALEAMDFAQAKLQSNLYMSGVLFCPQDEALVIEMPEPQAHYWNLGIFDSLGGSAQPHMRPTSINGHQAVIDADGIFRAVVSHRDPGYANWLDAAGRDVMLTMFRGNGLAAAPEVRIHRMKLDRLASFMPRASQRCSPVERQTMLRQRLHAAYRRLMIDY